MKTDVPLPCQDLGKALTPHGNQRVSAFIMSSPFNATGTPILDAVMPPAAEATILCLSHNVMNIIVAILICYSGTFVTLSLAKASLYVKSVTFRVMSGLSFVLQSVFALHFIDMVGMDFGVPWAFNLLWTGVSFALISIPGTTAIFLAISLRRDLEPQIEQEFPGYLHDPKMQTLAFQARYVCFFGTTYSGRGVWGVGGYALQRRR